MPSLSGLGGGIELYCRDLVEAVGLAWPDAALHALLGRERGLDRPLAVPVTVTGASGPARKPEMIARAAALALRLRPSLVVCGHVNYAVLARLLARGAPWVSVLHGIEAWQPHGVATRRALESADLTVAVSAFTAAQAMRALSLRELTVLSNAVDTERFTPGNPAATVEARLADLSHPRLLTVARLDAREAYKGVDQTLRALARMANAPSYVVVGDGTDRPRLEALARELRVPARFLGRVADGELADYYRACDLFVMPSRNEGFGFVFIEAMACGLPVIAGGVDGSVDALAGGRLGRLVNPLDVAEIAAAIEAELAAPPRPAAARHAEVKGLFGVAAFRQRVAQALARVR